MWSRPSGIMSGRLTEDFSDQALCPSSAMSNLPSNGSERRGKKDNSRELRSLLGRCSFWS